MPTITFETFDPTPYQRAPMLNVLESLSLGRALLQVMPSTPPEVVERAAAKLEAVLDEGEQAVDLRRRESVPVDLSGELQLDTVADGLWSALRNALEARAGLAPQGLPQLAEGHGRRSAIGKAVAAAEDQAARARALSVRLFGADGLSFTRARFPAQAQAMASMLRVIDEDGLDEEIEALVGPEILVLLRACQPRYESMVETRLARDARKSSDLGQMRTKILRATSRYTHAVLTMLDEDEPESLDRVIAALRPIEQIRARASSGSRAAASPEGRPAEAGGSEEPEHAAV